MKFWKEFQRRSENYRRLRPSAAGRWYIALTIALGVAALSSRNNILYLIESMLLSGMILSGILSERAISAVECSLLKGNAIAGEDAGDRVRVRNRRSFPVFCLEIGEWKDGELTALAFVPFLDSGEERIFRIERAFSARGKHRWDGLTVATSYPFGFARKMRILPHPGERLIWPPRAPSPKSAGDSRSTRFQGGDISEGEVRPFNPEDDSRLIVWTASTKGVPMVRVRRRTIVAQEIKLDLRGSPCERFEEQVRAAGGALYPCIEGANCPPLILIEKGLSRRIEGRKRALDALATVCALGIEEET